MGMQHIRFLTLRATEVLLAVLLTAAMFSLMPGLIDPTPARPRFHERGLRVEVVRLRQPEPPPRRRDDRKPMPPPQTAAAKRPGKPAAAITPPQMPVVPADLPFELNPQLPALPGMPKIPPMETVTVGAVGSTAAFGIDEIDRPLTPLAQAPPVYPLRARQQGIQGWVRVRFRVGRDGRVENVDILDAKPQRLFDRSVIRCISAWRFSPGTVAGLPVETLIETTVRFELDQP